MKNLVWLIILLACVTSYAQQDPIHAQYMNSPMLINPAYAGCTRAFSTSVAYRKQWVGFEGSPVTMNANGHIALADNKMGVGIILLQDEIGSNKTTEAEITYAYHLPINEDTRLSFGIQAGAVNYRSDYSNLTINPNDPKFASVSEWKPNVGAGLMLMNEKFMLSLSVPKMLNASNGIDSLTTSLYNRHFYGLAAYLIPLSYRVKLKPYVMARGVQHAPLSVDVGASIRVDDSYTIGVFTRNLNAYGFTAQINLGDTFRFGYVFELPSNSSVGLNFTSHEIMLGIRIKALRFHDITTIRNF